jgi:hypothetical protein
MASEQELTPNAALRILERELGDNRSPEVEAALSRLWDLVLLGK